MYAVLTYSLLLALLFLCSLLCYLLCKDSVRQSARDLTSKSTVGSIALSALSNRELLGMSQQPKYKKTNLEIEIPQTPREPSDSVPWETVQVETT